MTPSRALLILRSEVRDGRHQHRREALPWWIFGVLGGWLVVRFGPRLLADPLALPLLSGTDAGCRTTDRQPTSLGGKLPGRTP